mgnify:CR=1 FL=1
MKNFFSFKDVFSPKLFTTLRSYTKERFLEDALAGMIVAVVAIPLAIAFVLMLSSNEPSWFLKSVLQLPYS